MNRRPADLDARLIAWLEEGPTSGPEEVLSKAFARARSTRQDRVWLHRLIQPTRFQAMNTMLKVAVVAAFALAVGVTVLPRAPDIGSAPAPSPSPTPAPLRDGALPAGGYTASPFEGDAWAPCGPAEDPCPEAARDDGMRFTFTVPDGWAGAPLGSDIWLAAEHNSGPAGAGFLIGRGGWVYSDPCVGEDPDVPVGPTVDDFVDALATHPSIDVTEPVDIMLAGYPGKYLSLQGPADRTNCLYFRAWDPTFYAQGDSNLWHVWVIDVDGVRVVIHGSEFPDTAPERSAELAAIVESIQIEMVPPPAASETPMAEEVQATDEIASVAGEAGVPTVGTDLPAGATSGVIDTPIGLARWVHMSGDPATLPPGSPTRSGAKFSAVEGNRLEGRRLWTSEDGMRWTSEPIAAPTGAETASLWNRSGEAQWWYEPGPGAGRLLRSTDGTTLAAIDTSALIPGGPPSIEWELYWVSGATTGTMAAVDVGVVAREPFDTLGWVEGTELEPGVFGIRNTDRSPERRLRFEPVRDGLQVTDISDGSEVAMLEGTTLADVRGWARSGRPGHRVLAVLDGDRLSPIDLPELLEARPRENLIPMAPVADGIVALDLDDPSGPAIAWRLDQTGAWTELGPWDIGAGAPGGTFTIHDAAGDGELLAGTDYQFLAEYHEPGAPDLISQAWRSKDGEHWELFLESPPHDSTIAHVGRGFIATHWDGNEGKMWASPDGRTWTEMDLAGPDLPRDLGGGSDLVTDLVSRRLVGVGDAAFMIDQDRSDWWILAFDVRLD